MPRAGSAHCRNRCRAPRCRALSKASGYASRCCRCTRDATELCHLHRARDGPRTAPRGPERAATVGAGVRVGPSGLPGAGSGLFATVPFASRDVITRYEPNPPEHRGRPLLSRAEARAIDDQRWVMHKDGNYVAGLHPHRPGLGGGSMANDNGGPYNAEAYVPPGRLDRVYLRVKAGKVIRPGEEIFLSYGTGRAVAMGARRLGAAG